MDIASGLKQDIVHELSLMLHQENQHVQNLQTAQELLRDNDSNQALKVVIYKEKWPRTEHARRFNRPVSDEISILMPNAPTNNRDIVLHYCMATWIRFLNCTMRMMLYSTLCCFLMVLMVTTST